MFPTTHSLFVDEPWARLEKSPTIPFYDYGFVIKKKPRLHCNKLFRTRYLWQLRGLRIPHIQTQNLAQTQLRKCPLHAFTNFINSIVLVHQVESIRYTNMYCFLLWLTYVINRTIRNAIQNRLDKFALLCAHTANLSVWAFSPLVRQICTGLLALLTLANNPIKTLCLKVFLSVLSVC